ncbi:ATP-binding cassette sub- F member 3 [Desmophyllum pertusum]|uniref:ATP-binding cassette sub- F member 3 n=1 Tax=Desmophyllum pertusum TaxID=174260 RepID=A0A9W9YT10_9CNID|nr:ATP-binding cassette sub- F member 3 [Desmophyllum pertusum]
MLDQSILVRSQVAFIFLLLASASLASANAICKCGNGDADPPSKKVVDYNVQISESGQQYNETIEVDTEKQTELFKVPAHNDVDHSNILHDFKMNMSMMLLPEKKICYYLPLQDGLLTPRKLINSLDTAERTVSKTTKTTIFDNKWIVDREMTDRSVLSDELAIFCAKYPIYYVKRMKDSLTSTRIQTGGE